MYITTMDDLNNHSVFYLVPEKVLDELIEAIKSIRKLQETLERGEENTKAIGDYIEESQAMKILRRRKTWFWNKRKKGELSGKKAAGRWYYKEADILKYIENGRSI
jgi:hypothetical protein